MNRSSVRAAALVAMLIAMLGAVAMSAGAQRGAPAAPAGPPEKLDLAALAKIRDEGFNRSKMQNTVIVASFVYNTANRDQQLPRKPAPLRAGGGRGRGAQ